MTETAEVFMKAMLLGMEPEDGAHAFADPEPVEILPFEEALAYMKKRVPVDKETYYALNDKMRYRAFTVGRLADGDAVKKVQGMLSDALENGSGLNKFLQMTEGDLADAVGMGRGVGWYYETVYRTNTSTAYNVGRAIVFEETPPIALELLGIDDARQTETCHALTVPPFRRKYDDPVWKGLWPPFHFNCRTTVRGIYDEAEIEEAGGADTFYSRGTPDYKPDKGFGTYPVDKSDSWWDLTDAMKERAEMYGLLDEFDEVKDLLIRPELPQPTNLVEFNGDTNDFIEKSLGIKKGEPMSIEAAYKEANPNFNKGKEYQSNCGNSVVAFELRCRGFDVEAMPGTFNVTGAEVFEDPIIKGHAKLYGDGSKLTQIMLEKELEALPEGSRSSIFIKKVGKMRGHTFVGVKSGGVVKFYDPQSGVQCQDLLDGADRGFFAYYRMDTLQISNTVDLKYFIKGK